MPEEVRLPFLIGEVADEMQINKSDVQRIIKTFFEIIAEELKEGNTVKISPYLKLSFRVAAPVKKGTLVRNPFTQESAPSPGRPAKLSVRATALSGLKNSAPEPTSKVGKTVIASKK
jgi:nucleoid DNA-binding protein